MSEAEHPSRRGREVTVDDVRQLKGASTPHFALQLRNRIAKLIRDLPPEHPARVEGELEIRRLTELGFTGEVRGTPHEEGIEPLPSVGDDAHHVRETPAGH
jgi:hypothetical protein